MALLRQVRRLSHPELSHIRTGLVRQGPPTSHLKSLRFSCLIQLLKYNQAASFSSISVAVTPIIIREPNGWMKETKDVILLQFKKMMTLTHGLSNFQLTTGVISEPNRTYQNTLAQCIKLWQKCCQRSGQSKVIFLLNSDHHSLLSSIFFFIYFPPTLQLLFFFPLQTI